MSSLRMLLFLGTAAVVFEMNSGCAQKKVSSTGAPPPAAQAPFFMTRAVRTEPVELVLEPHLARPHLVNYRSEPRLRMSGSAAFGPQALSQLKRTAKKAKTVLVVFDLRQESHGLINDQPATWQAPKDWGNAELNHDEAVRRERRLLGDLKVGDFVGGVEIKSIETEESMIRTASVEYVRLTVNTHTRPVDSEVDRFLQAVDSLPANSWVHFHCRNGDDRTVSLMLMYDMLLNSDKESFDEIVLRHQLMHQNVDPKVELFKADSIPDWQKPYQNERALFLKEFYDFAKARSQDKVQSSQMLWSQWKLRALEKDESR